MLMSANILYVCDCAVKHIFISQMKSSGIICSSPQQPEGQHAFLFSLRALDSKKGKKLDISLYIPLSNQQSDWSPSDRKLPETSITAPSTLLPLFSKGSQAKLTAFACASQQQTFQKENKGQTAGLMTESQAQGCAGSQIMEAKPRSNFCQICKETFSDYLKHLTHPVHVRKFEAQCKNKMIDQLVKGLKNNNFTRGRAQPLAVQDEDGECEHIPCKVRVIQMQNTLTPMRVASQIKNCSSSFKSQPAH